MKKHRQLTFTDRIYIEVLHWERKSQAEIARRIGVHPSTISREMRRGDTGRPGTTIHIGYRGDIGETRRKLWNVKRGRPAKLVGALAKYVETKIKEGWSPEQISGRMKLEGKVGVSRETIYKFVKTNRDNGGVLYLHLRHGRRKRKKRFAIARVRSDILNRRSIDSRPKNINDRTRVGDWERDLMFGNSRSKALLTFVERKTRYVMIKKVESKSPAEVAEKTISAMSETVCRSITNDSGFEFGHHELESLYLDVPIYFANPYSSWERGTCENANGLIRQYFSHNQDMENFYDKDAQAIAEALNSRPRKTLGFRTPNEAFAKEKIAIISG